LGLSTSGNSKNVIKAFEQAKSQSLTTIAFTGQGGGALAPLTDILIDIPSKMTPLIQQGHLLTYHYYCEQIENLISDQGLKERLITKAS
jgi:D-sedoheptulose 7-phosphate isomerase